MKIENLARAQKVQLELRELDVAIKRFEKLRNGSDNFGFSFAQYSDTSGCFIDKQYLDGDYHPMYNDILEFAYNKFVEARLDLLAEIEDL